MKTSCFLRDRRTIKSIMYRYTQWHEQLLIYTYIHNRNRVREREHASFLFVICYNQKHNKYICTITYANCKYINVEKEWGKAKQSKAAMLAIRITNLL